MATLKAYVDSYQKEDKTHNVKIRLTHKRKIKKISTALFVVKGQFTKTFELKDPEVIEVVNERIKAYRQIILKLGLRIDSMDVTDIFDAITATIGKQGIDFIEFINTYVSELQAKGKNDYAKSYITVRNALTDYFKNDKVTPKEINYNFLIRWESFLRKPRTMTRMSNRVQRTYMSKGVGDSGLHNHMRDLRTLFREAQRRFNNDEINDIKIPHYPFNKYKVGAAPKSEHRDRTIEEIRLIRDCNAPDGSRAELARDLFMVSFYLLGMNAADIFLVKLPLKERITYNRSKTKDRRKDKATISVKVVPEAKDLIVKCIKSIHSRYSVKSSLLTAISKGLKQVSEITGIEALEFYDARHSVGTLTRRKLGYSKDEVSEILNHVQSSTTDIYIAQDWSLHDKVQRDLIDLVRSSEPTPPTLTTPD